MSKQPCYWNTEDRLKEISAKGDPLETLAEAVDFERFRPILEETAGRPRSPKGGRPALDAVLKFKMLALQSFHGLSLEATETMVRDRLVTTGLKLPKSAEAEFPSPGGGMPQYLVA